MSSDTGSYPPTTTRCYIDIKTGVISNEDIEDIWEDVKVVAIEKVRENKNGELGGDSILIDESEVEKSF